MTARSDAGRPARADPPFAALPMAEFQSADFLSMVKPDSRFCPGEAR